MTSRYDEKPSRYASGQRYGNKYGHQHYRGGDDGRGDALHGMQGGLLWCLAFGDVDLHGLHHHDGIVDHQTDGQHQTQQWDDVDGESEYRKQCEGTDERYGNGDDGYERGAPLAQKEVDDDDDQQKGDDQGLEDVADSCGDALCGVDDRGVGSYLYKKYNIFIIK